MAVGDSDETVAVPTKPSQNVHTPSTIRCPAAAATLPTKIPGFAQLSGCLRAIEGLSLAQQAARQALAAATAVAIARVMEQTGCKTSQTEVPCGSTVSCVGSVDGDSVGGTGSTDSGSAALSSAVPKQASRSTGGLDSATKQRASAESLPAQQRSSTRAARGIFSPHVGIFSHKGTWVCPSAVAPRLPRGLNAADVETKSTRWGSQIQIDMPEDASGRSGVTAVLSSMPSPRVVARRNMRPGVKQPEGANVTQLQETPASEVAAVPESGTLVADSQMLEAAATSGTIESILPSFDEAQACSVRGGDDEFGIADCEGSLMTSCGMGSLFDIAQAELQAEIDGIDDAETLTAAETAEPSERSLRNDESMASLLSMQSIGSVPTQGAYSCTGTNGSAMDNYKEDDPQALGESPQSTPRKLQMKGVVPMRPAGQPPEALMFGKNAPRPPGQMSKKFGGAEPFSAMREPLTALKALYGRPVPRPWSSSRPMTAGQMSSRPVSARLGTPRTPQQPPRTPQKPRTPRMTGVPFGRQKVRSPHTPRQMARRMEMHLSGACDGSRSVSKDRGSDQEVHTSAECPPGKLPPLASCGGLDDGVPMRSALAHGIQTWSAAEMQSTGTTPRGAPVIFSAEACNSVSSPPSEFRHAQRRRSSIRIGSRYRYPLGQGLPDYAYMKAPGPDPRNIECPFSKSEIEESVILCCGHRFSLEHLGLAMACSQYQGIAPSGYIVCPLCGDAQRYGPEVLARTASTTPYKHGHHTIIYSDNKRAYVGNVLDNSWDSVTTLPLNA